MKYTINHDPSDYIMSIIPALREHASKNKRFGKYPITVHDFNKLIKRSLEMANQTTNQRTVYRVVNLFSPYEQNNPKFIDHYFVKILTINNVPEDAIYDILYIHHCWANPFLRYLIEFSFYPYFITRDKILRNRIRDDIIEKAGKYTDDTLKNSITPLRKHQFIVSNKINNSFEFTYKKIHPIAFLYATYRDFERLGLKILGVHRINNLMNLEYMRWLLLTRAMVADIIKELDEKKLVDYSYQIEEQLHIKFSFNDFLNNLSESKW